MTYATARGFIDKAKIKYKNKIYDVENVQFLTHVDLDRYGDVDDFDEEFICLDYDLHPKYNIKLMVIEGEELIIEDYKKIEWSDIDYEVFQDE